MDIFTTALGGLERAASTFERSASRLSRASATVSDGPAVDAVDLSATVVDLLKARNEFATNLKVLQTGDDLERTALNILA